eukprot:SAG22_NODE_18262_length_290_cov_0.816754_1_plen_91_part_10
MTLKATIRAHIEADVVRVGFHGTTAANAKSILADGFRPSIGGMLGRGVYWSDDIKKTATYGDGTVLKLHVSPGRTKRIDQNGHPLQQKWYR